MPLHIVEAKAVVAFFRAVSREFVDAVAQPVVVSLPMSGGNEVLESPLDARQPACVVCQAVQTHETEGCLAVVVDDAFLSLDAQVRMVEHMDEPAIGLLHVQHTHRQSFEQRQVLSVAREFGVLHQGQQADGIAAQLDLVAGVDQEGCLPAIRQRGRLDQAAGEVLERPVDGLPVAFVLREFPALEQGVGRAGMAQRVVGRDGFVEAGEPAVLVFACLLYTSPSPRD